MKKFNYDIDYVRAQFPCHSRSVNGYPAAFLDGPGGSQVPRRVVDKIADYLFYHNANGHGIFRTSLENDKMYWEAKETVADFLNCEACEVAFGGSSSTNNFLLAHGIARDLQPGDELLITDLDHECNRSPWRTLEERGFVIKSVAVHPETCTIDVEDFKAKLSAKTKVFAINWAANACGTITDVKSLIQMAHEVGAIAVVDAVHYAAHQPIDVKEIDTDFLICSAYKFFGPHMGVLYGKKKMMEKVRTIRVMADDNTEAPWRCETGTPAFELAAGVAEAVEFIADLGKKYEESFSDELEGLTGRRRFVVSGMKAIDAYEEPMAKKLRTELAAIPGVKVYGPEEGNPRTSTVSFTVEGKSAHDVALFLAERGIFVWDGDFYAIQIINHVLDLEKEGGLVRIGLAPYNTMEEIHRTIQAVKDFVAK